MDYRCRKCGTTEGLEVQAAVWLRLHQSEDNIETDADQSSCGDHEWDHKAPMQCTECGFEGRVDDFDADKEPEAT